MSYRACVRWGKWGAVGKGDSKYKNIECILVAFMSEPITYTYGRMNDAIQLYIQHVSYMGSSKQRNKTEFPDQDETRPQLIIFTNESSCLNEVQTIT